MALTDTEVMSNAGNLVTELVAELPSTDSLKQNAQSLGDTRKVLLRASQIIHYMLADKRKFVIH